MKSIAVGAHRPVRVTEVGDLSARRIQIVMGPRQTCSRRFTVVLRPGIGKIMSWSALVMALIRIIVRPPAQNKVHQHF